MVCKSDNYANLSWIPTSLNNNLQITTHEKVLEILLIETFISTVKTKPNELGSLWKWIAETPDHDDFVIINDILDKLIINNTKQFTANSEIFEVTTELTDTINNIKGDTTARKIKKKSIYNIIYELKDIINTITFGKIGIINPTILHVDELKNIIYYQHGTMTIRDLIDILKFKIAQKRDIIVLYIKYL